ncbi:UDP-3-O-(3-hydroxymyristoyl)glucosamine N-acyltransferase [uncultured Demequina sp.]|uniref:UDP-3-O-(3-hydroxymyristoyl)glucosamine N-acyltransferase n=1 Tax=uncultured Demequina sp. TaxID=693499 RepID=UPI0025D8AB0C|nr:UDP-3-O-(3-hydroxymyristoyl)glucosamine N-acyltransferase [uncultured Demequina sp.]
MALTLSELARLVDGDIVRGELSHVIEGIAALDEATSADVSFLGNEKYRAQYLATRAGAVIVPRGVEEGPEGVALVAVENPSFAFGRAVKHFTEALARRFEPGVHERAVVDPAAVLDPARVRVDAGAVVMAGASVGDGSEIGPNAVVGEGVRIGRDCRIHANVSIRERCEIGDRVILQPGAVIGSDGFGYETVKGRHEKIDQIGIVVLEDDVEIGANTTVDRARFGRTVISEGTKVDNLVQIGHNVRIGRQLGAELVGARLGPRQTDTDRPREMALPVQHRQKVSIVALRQRDQSRRAGGPFLPLRPQARGLTQRIAKLVVRPTDIEAQFVRERFEPLFGGGLLPARPILRQRLDRGQAQKNQPGNQCRQKPPMTMPDHPVSSLSACGGLALTTFCPCPHRLYQIPARARPNPVFIRR